MSIQYNCSTCKETKFLLFAGDNYYPSGGWSDFKGIFDSIEDALDGVDDCRTNDWFEIVSVETLEKVLSGHRSSEEWKIFLQDGSSREAD